MIPIGVFMAWGGYTIAMWGYCLVRGYNVTFLSMFKTTWPGVTITPPTAGHKLGTIQGSTSTTNPGNLLGPQ